eukprot:7686630-Pyramimonas_sp.AAC.1
MNFIVASEATPSFGWIPSESVRQPGPGFRSEHLWRRNLRCGVQYTRGANVQNASYQRCEHPGCLRGCRGRLGGGTLYTVPRAQLLSVRATLRSCVFVSTVQVQCKYSAGTAQAPCGHSAGTVQIHRTIRGRRPGAPTLNSKHAMTNQGQKPGLFRLEIPGVFFFLHTPFQPRRLNPQCRYSAGTVRVQCGYSAGTARVPLRIVRAVPPVVVGDAGIHVEEDARRLLPHRAVV